MSTSKAALPGGAKTQYVSLNIYDGENAIATRYTRLELLLEYISNVRRSPSEVDGVHHQNKQRILQRNVRTGTSYRANFFVYFDDALHILLKATSIL
jgi:hypothetical protein